MAEALGGAIVLMTQRLTVLEPIHPPPMTMTTVIFATCT